MNETTPQLKLLKGGVYDSRFGMVDLFAVGDSKTPCVFSVNTCCKSEQEFELTVAHNQSRLALDCPSLLQMIGLQTAIETKTLIAYFEFPSCAFSDCLTELKSSENELFRLVFDIVSAIAYLERLGAAHGELRPEMIAYSEARQTYILLDRFNSPLTPEMAWKESNGRTYLSPTAFMSPNSFNCYKNDLFSLGLIVLEIFVGSAAIQSLYDHKTNVFDTKTLTSLIASLKAQKSLPKRIEKCLTEHMLSVNEWSQLIASDLINLLTEDPQKVQIDSKDDWGAPDDEIINNFDVPNDKIDTQEVDFLKHDKDSVSALIKEDDNCQNDDRSIFDVDFVVNRPIRTVSECAPDNRSNDDGGSFQIQSRTEVVSLMSPVTKKQHKRDLFLKEIGSQSNFKLKYVPTVSLMGDEGLTPQTSNNHFFPTSNLELLQTTEEAIKNESSFHFMTPERKTMEEVPQAMDNLESTKPVKPEFLLSHHLSFAERTDALTSSAVQEAERESLAQDLLIALTEPDTVKTISFGNKQQETVSQPKVLALTQVYYITDVHRNLSVKVFCEVTSKPVSVQSTPKKSSVTFVNADLNYAKVVTNLSLNSAKIN